MRIYAVADIHGHAGRLALIKDRIARHGPDVLVLAGDVGNYLGHAKIFSFLNELGLPVLMVRGNSDPQNVTRRLPAFDRICSLHLDRIVIQDVAFIGIDGTLPVPFRSRTNLFEAASMARLARLVTPQTILVAHPPPFGVLDRVLGKWHAGSKNLAALARDKRPGMVICGHIHENAGQAAYHGIPVINCSLGRGQAGALIDYSPGRNPDIEML